MDTRFWGPSGWDLFHRIAFHSDNPHQVLKHIAEVLPCKFCRNSTRKFVKDFPYDSKDPSKWLYEIHNKVNHKLRSQCANDPKVINPGPNPSFEEIQKRYKNKLAPAGNRGIVSHAGVHPFATFWCFFFFPKWCSCF
jgi:hypothetical protein